jgi:hypothetical protein
MQYNDMMILSASRREVSELNDAIIADDDNNRGGGQGMVFWINDTTLLGEGHRVTL